MRLTPFSITLAILFVIAECQLINTTGTMPGLGTFSWHRSTMDIARVGAVGDGTLFVAFLNNSIAALNATSGTTIWRYDAWTDSGSVQWVGVYGNVLAFQTHAYMAGISAVNGSAVWNTTSPGAQRFHTDQLR